MKWSNCIDEQISTVPKCFSLYVNVESNASEKGAAGLHYQVPGIVMVQEITCTRTGTRIVKTLNTEYNCAK